MTAEQGVIVAALTPFHDRKTIVNQAQMEMQLERLAKLEPAAVTVGAVETQEFQVLSSESRVGLVGLARRVLPTDIDVLAGVSHPSLRQSMDLAKEAEQRGAAGVVALAAPKPWGAAPLPDEAIKWFHVLADESPIPVMVYNNPRLTVDLTVTTLKRICEHPNISGIKETSRDESKLLALVSSVQPHASVFTNMELLFSTLVLGGAGAMLPGPGLPIAKRLSRSLAEGKISEAAELARFFATFPGKWMRWGLLPVMKVASALMGCDVGSPLWPYESLTDEESKEMHEYLGSWDLLGALAE